MSLTVELEEEDMPRIKMLGNQYPYNKLIAILTD